MASRVTAHVKLRTKASHRHMRMISLLIFHWKWIKLVKIIWGQQSPDCTFLFDLYFIIILFAIVCYSFFVFCIPVVFHCVWLDGFCLCSCLLCGLNLSLSFCINPQLQACFVVSIFWGISFLEAWKGNASTIYKGMPQHLHVLHFVLHARKVN